ncbi:MAG: ModD protein [Bacteroidales bacterium]|nr:ModD protein [Bacteroidales bacterium]
MIYFTDSEIEALITEDVPYYDLTTSLLKLENKPAKIQFATTESTVICCTEEVLKIFSKLAVHTTLFTPSGEYLEGGVKFLEGEGLSKNIHAAWRVSENLLAFASGIATRTRKLVNAAAEVNENIVIGTSRRTIPYTKKVAVKAVQSGGASIHRLGLSESILIFKNHYSFLTSLDNLGKRLKSQKKIIGTRTVSVEARTQEDAIKIANAKVDIIQLTNFDPGSICSLKKELLKIHPGIKIAAAGHITLDNVKEYALCGADILVTSWPYFGGPAGIQSIITPLDN